MRDSSVDLFADALGSKRPRKTEVKTLADVKDLLERETDPTFEGFVLRDVNGLRLKIKSSQYLALHSLADNGNLASYAKLVPLVLKGELNEIATYFKELVPKLLQISKAVWSEKHHLEVVYSLARNIENQKEFAQFVTANTKLSAFLFEARKKKVEVEQVWKEKAEDWFVKHIEEIL